MNELLATLKQAPDKITTVYASIAQSRGVAESLFQALTYSGSTVSPQLLRALLKYPLSYPLTEIDLMFCTCISGLVTQDASRTEHVFVSLLSSVVDDTVTSRPHWKEAYAELIKKILEALPTTIKDLAAAIQLTVPPVHCTKMAVPWMELVLYLAQQVDGIVYGATEAVIKLLLIIDSHIDAYSASPTEAEQLPGEAREASSAGSTVGSYISPSFEANAKLAVFPADSGNNVNISVKKGDDAPVEACTTDDAASLTLYTSLMDNLLVLYFDYLRSVHSVDPKEYVKLFQDTVIPVFVRLCMSLRSIRFVQFTIFYAASLADSLAGWFVEFLIRRSMFDMDAPVSVYLDSMNYVGGFVARYARLSARINVNVVNLLLQFVTQLGNEIDTSALSALDRLMGIQRVSGEVCINPTFRGIKQKGDAQILAGTIPSSVIRYLSVARVLLYVLCFLADELNPQEIHIDELSAFLFSDLCPLMYFYTIGVHVLDVMYKWSFLTPDELSRVHTILEYAQKFELPYSVLLCFYPFEPMCLRRTNGYIAPLYREYSARESEDE